MNVCDKSVQTDPYALLRAALTLFKKTPDELQEAELRQAEVQAINEFKIENRILNSQESGAVIISDKELQ
ncbi:MAG: nitrogen fixation protein NifM, partial [Methylococcaceae bacterium]